MSSGLKQRISITQQAMILVNLLGKIWYMTMIIFAGIVIQRSVIRWLLRKILIGRLDVRILTGIEITTAYMNPSIGRTNIHNTFVMIAGQDLHRFNK